MIPLTTDRPRLHLPILTLLIIAANVAVFVLWQQPLGLNRSVAQAALVPVEITEHMPGAYEKLWFAMFMHGGWMHLIGNMWFLWVFGPAVEDLCGPIRYLCFYLASGALASLAFVLGSPDSATPLVGASGAISGVLGAFLLRYWNARVQTLVPLGIFTRIMNIPAYFFLLYWIGLQLFFQVLSRRSEGGGGVAYLAHLGGFVAGLVLIFIFEKSSPKAAAPERGWQDYQGPGDWK